MTPQAQGIVRDAVVRVCQFREWGLYALHVRSNHLHGVVDAPVDASRVVNAWKAYATRALRESELVDPTRLIWAHGASCHELGKEKLGDAIRYVLDGQGEGMATFEAAPRLCAGLTNTLVITKLSSC